MSLDTKVWGKRTETAVFVIYAVFCVLAALVTDVAMNFGDSSQSKLFSYLYPFGTFCIFILYYSAVFFLFAPKSDLNYKILFFGFALPETVLLLILIQFSTYKGIGFELFVPNAVFSTFPEIPQDGVTLFVLMTLWIQPVVAASLFFTKAKITKEIVFRYLIPVSGIIAVKALLFVERALPLS